MIRVATAIALVACHAPPPAPDAQTDLCTDQQPLAPTFANIQRLFTGRCTTCHTAGVELDLEAGVSYGNLVGRAAPNYSDPVTDESCGGTLVVPGDPAASYLYQKLSLAQPCAGAQMPRTDIGTSSPLVACAQLAVHDWIAAGAPSD
jgi:hypothetical protein